MAVILNYRGAQIARAGKLIQWPKKAGGFSDAFNRSDGALEASPGWTLINGPAGGAGIRSNQLAALAGEGAYRVTDQGSANHYVQAQAAAYVAAPGMFLACRLTDSGNWVGIICNSTSGGTEVWRRVGGTYTSLAAAAGGAVAVGDTIRLETTGTTWRALKNGTQIGSGAIGDPSLTSTRQGVVNTSAQNPAWDNFQAGRL